MRHQHYRGEMQIHCAEDTEGRRLDFDLVYSSHHGKDGRVSDGCGVDASLR